MKQKHKTNKSKVCFEFESKCNSMKTVINSLETISAKCELFFTQFNVQFEDQNQLDDYKRVLARFKSQLASDDVRQTSDDNELMTHHKSDDQSDNESYSVANTLDNGFSDTEDQSNDRTDIFSTQNGSQTSADVTRDELCDKILDFYTTDKKSGKKVRQYGCPLTDCGFKSILRNNVVQHLITHTTGSDHRCCWPKCEKSFGFRNSLISHIESYHLRKERFRCCVEDCGQSFLSKINFKSHMNIKHSDITEHNCNWTECNLSFNTCSCHWPNCRQQFTNRQLLESHLETFHLKKQKHFKSEETLSEDSDADQWLKCEQSGCDFQTPSKRDLTKHSSTHKSRYIPINRRKDVNEKEDRNKEPEYHKYTGKPLRKKRRPRNFKCTWPACDAMFESQHTVSVHMRKHTGEKPFECDWPECGKRFRFKGALKLHKESIHLRLKQFKCDQCDEAFRLLTALVVHKAKHTGVKRLQCSWPGCEWRTNFGQQLELHVKRVHEGKKIYFKRYKTKNKSDPNSMYDANGILKPYACEWPGCERRFRFEYNLEPHIQWHQKREHNPNQTRKKYVYPKKPKPDRPKVKRGPRGPNDPKQPDKPWRCDWPNCQSSYMSKSMLSQHYNLHTGEKPFQCRQCEQAFPYKSSLNAHQTLHHPSEDQIVNKPFKCQTYGCHRSFDKPRALIAHQRIAHQKKLTKEQIPSMAQPIEEYSSSTGFSSPPPEMQSAVQSIVPPEPFYFQRNVIRLDRIKAFNALQIQTQNQSLITYPSTAYRRERHCPTPTQTTHTTAKKLLTNALKRPRTQIFHNNPVDNEAIAKELPHPCTHTGCWRRFKSVKALDWHLKKFHEVSQSGDEQGAN